MHGLQPARYVISIRIAVESMASSQNCDFSSVAERIEERLNTVRYSETGTSLQMEGEQTAGNAQLKVGRQTSEKIWTRWQNHRKFTDSYFCLDCYNSIFVDVLGSSSARANRYSKA